VGTRGDFLGGRNDWYVKLTTHLHLVPNSRMVDLYLHFPYVFHGVVLN
jgi:hypothetical protein